MKLIIQPLLFTFLFICSCKKADNDELIIPNTSNLSTLQYIAITADFNVAKTNQVIPLTTETPAKYIIATKRITLLGKTNVIWYDIYNTSKLWDSKVWSFLKNYSGTSIIISNTIPDGLFHSIYLEIYYLQMTICIRSNQRGNEFRNIRIYLTEDDTHKPGDITQLNEKNEELGWIFGEGQQSDLSPVKPRLSAYTHGGDGSSWYEFDGKSAKDFGPFGSVEFWKNASSPFSTTVPFTIDNKAYKRMFIEFNVNQCWQFEDISEDGVYGADDLNIDSVLSKWQIIFPTFKVKFEL